MHTVKVFIGNKDRKVGAMIKALAVEVSGFEAVKGTTKEFLSAHGYYEFHFPSKGKAKEFQEAIEKYVPSGLAHL
ncbi:MAG TPA: hypothetical protein VNU49_03190 [Opitutaceae bacterium]|jgi:hypothetical protein|nr:hypothetical protein [Opitutaceae bacterium]